MLKSIARPIARPIACALVLAGAAAAVAAYPPAWTRATAARHLIGPVDYVGTEGLASYLIKTDAGAILIDGTLAANVPAIERNIAARGTKVGDVKLMLLSHAHFDHAAGLAALQKDSGAALAVGAGDADAVATGIPPGETDYGVIRFPAARVTRAVRDGETVSLGHMTLTAIATPGHTPGCTSWAMRIVAAGKPRDILFLCSFTVAGNVLVGNKRYPGIVDDFRRTFDRLARVHADVVLPFHPEQVDLFARQMDGRLIDPALLPRLVEEGRVAFEAALAKQQT